MTDQWNLRIIYKAVERLSRRGGANQSTLRRTELVTKHAPAARVQGFIVVGARSRRERSRDGFPRPGKYVPNVVRHRRAHRQDKWNRRDNR